MTQDDPRSRMWADAVDMLARAERLHRQMFEPQPTRRGAPSWAPPIDLLETPLEVLVLAALPGVVPDQIEASIQNGELVIAGHRALPSEWGRALIHRLELPQGRFERRVALPPGAYTDVSHALENGCLVVRLKKAG